MAKYILTLSFRTYFALIVNNIIVCFYNFFYCFHHIFQPIARPLTKPWLSFGLRFVRKLRNGRKEKSARPSSASWPPNLRSRAASSWTARSSWSSTSTLKRWHQTSCGGCSSKFHTVDCSFRLCLFLQCFNAIVSISLPVSSRRLLYCVFFINIITYMENVFTRLRRCIWFVCS